MLVNGIVLQPGGCSVSFVSMVTPHWLSAPPVQVILLLCSDSIKKKNTPQFSRSEAVTWASCLEGEINPGSGDWSLLYCKGDEVKRQLAHRLCQRPLICYCHDETLSQVKRYGLLDMSYLMSPVVHVTIFSIHLSLLKPECTSGTTPLPL